MNRNDILKTVRFDHPDAVPVVFHVNLACWESYPREELAGLIRDHPVLFPAGPPPFATPGATIPYPPWCIGNRPWIDPWGCRWETNVNGYVGIVRDHPLADPAALASFRAPDPEKTTHWAPVDWGDDKHPPKAPVGFFPCLRSAEIGHGHTFLRLIDLFGYEKAVCGLADEDPALLGVLSVIEQFNYDLASRFVGRMKVEWLGYAEDLGMQYGPLISPALFRRHIMPSYRRIIGPAHGSNVIAHLHSDGDIRALAPDLLRLPLDVLNIQDIVNGPDWIAENLKGRVTIDLDIDRQKTSVFGTPEKIRRHVLEVLELLYDPAGGLILTFGLYPGTPLENVAALMDVLEAIAAGDLPRRPPRCLRQ